MAVGVFAPWIGPMGDSISIKPTDENNDQGSLLDFQSDRTMQPGSDGTKTMPVHQER
jgi:hypothetical protein